jgi:two-component system response regulator MprA
MGTATPTASRPWHVLVVDDDGDIRDALREWLSGEGFEVEVASDGLEALGIVDVTPLDAIVCDLDMPRLHGIELVRRLRRAGRNVVIVLLSAHFDLLASAHDLGEVYAMAKPCVLERLVRTLREALAGRS